MVAYGGTNLGTGQDLVARLRRGLLETEAFPVRPNHRLAVDFLVEAHDRSTPQDAKALATAVAALLDDDEAKVRSGAIRFFQGSTAVEPSALLAALNADRGRYEGVADPLAGATGDLRHELARAAARRLGEDPALRDAIRTEALRPGRGRTVIAALGLNDADWLRAHALDVAAANPDAPDALDHALRTGGADLAVLRLKTAILNAATDLEKRRGRQDLRARIAELLGGEPTLDEAGDRTRCVVSAGARGPTVAWTVRDGVLDPGAGITITLDTSATAGDFDLVEYRYDADGQYQGLDVLDFTAVFRS